MLNKYPRLRYCKIRRGTKKPFEQDWTNKPYKWEEIEEFTKESNYGVLCGHGDLAVIDSDNPELQKQIEEKLPKTLRIKTGSGGIHNYFFIPHLKKKIILTTDLTGREVHWGEVQSYGTQVVGPGSTHPNGKQYEIIEREPIKTLTEEELLSAILPFMKQIQEIEQSSKWERKEYGSEIDNLNVGDIWGTHGFKEKAGEYYGGHPIHGSEGGMNFWLNPNKNLWHCFRHDSGGGPLSAIAVKDGVIDCSQAHKGALRGSKAFEAIQIAKDKYGLKETKIVEKIVKKNFELIWEKDLQDYETEDKEWIIDKLIPSKAVGVWTGKRGTMKTFIVLNAISCVAAGKDFLDKYPTVKGKVIYLDKENGVYVMKQRMPMIKKGLELEEPLDIGFICFSTLKIDRIADIEQIKEIVAEHKPNLLIVDTYRRGISFEENDAGKVSELFVDTLRPLVEKYNLSIVLIHHDRKGESQGDEMDMIRGSSDLANYSDFILKNERKGKNLILKQLKMRMAPEESPMEIGVSSDEESYIGFNCLGEYTPQTKDKRCAEILTGWIIKRGIKEFTTKEAIEVAFSEGIKKQNFYNGLQVLIDNGLIVKEEHGKYVLISKDLKLVV